MSAFQTYPTIMCQGSGSFLIHKICRLGNKPGHFHKVLPLRSTVTRVWLSLSLTVCCFLDWKLKRNINIETPALNKVKHSTEAMCHVGRLYKKEVAARRLATVATSKLYQSTAQIACSQIGDIPQLLRSNLTADARSGGAASVEMEYLTMKFREMQMIQDRCPWKVWDGSTNLDTNFVGDYEVDNNLNLITFITCLIFSYSNILQILIDDSNLSAKRRHNVLRWPFCRGVGTGNDHYWLCGPL